jgi:hypothetical protein
MKKFSQLKPVKSFKKINEQDEAPKIDDGSEVKSNLPEETEEQENTETQPTSGDAKADAIKLFSKLFESREMAHIYHLQVKGDQGSYAKHIALQLYYEGDDEGEGGILDSLDTLIEMYQGQFGIIEGYDLVDTKESTSKDPIQYFEELASYVKQARKCFNEEDTHYFNVIDDIMVLIYQTIYKLKYTK